MFTPGRIFNLSHPTNGSTLRIEILDRPGTPEHTMHCTRTNLAIYSLTEAPEEIKTVTRCHRPPHILNDVILRTLAVAMSDGFEPA